MSEAIKRAEGVLYKHFRRLDNIERKRRQLKRVENRIESIMKDISECKYTLTESLKAIQYDKERVQTSGVSNEVENTLMKAAEALERELAYHIKKKFKIKSQIEDMEMNIENMETLLGRRTDEENKILYLKYGKKMRHREIGAEIGCDHSRISRMKNDIALMIAEEMNLI